MSRSGRSLVPFLLLAALAAVVHLRTRPATGAAQGPEVSLELAQEIFPAAAELGMILPGEPVEVRDAAGTVLGTLLDTTPYCADHPGYGGPVPCAVGLSPERRVVGVRLLANAESPTFIEYVVEQGLLNGWNGLSVEEAATRQVDAISGATATCIAIAGSVQQALAAQGAVQAAGPARSARLVWTRRVTWGVLALALLSAALGWLVPGLRLVARLATVTVFGFLAGTCLSLALTQNWLARGVPWARFPIPAAMAAVAVLLPLLTGRGIYCAHVCPYGSAQDLAAMLWRWRRPRLPRVAAWTLQTLRGVALIALFVAVVAGVEFDLTAVEPFAAFQWRSAPLAGVFLALGFVLVSVFLPRTWCLHLCPTGYLLGKCRGLHAPGEVPRTLFTFERGALLAALAAAIVLALPRPEALPPALPGAPVPGVDMGLSTVEPSPPYSHEVPDVLTAIHERRSVRHYTDDPVMPAQLDTLVRAAMAAPTAGNAQPWSFIVVTEQKRLQGLSDALPYGKMLAKAGAAIVVCGVPAKALPGEPAPLWVLDCTAAAENLLLAAHGIGLGAVWVAAYPYEERMAGVRTVCGIPAEIQPLCVISLGVPAGVEQPKDKYSSDNVHWEKW